MTQRCRFCDCELLAEEMTGACACCLVDQERVRVGIGIVVLSILFLGALWLAFNI